MGMKMVHEGGRAYLRIFCDECGEIVDQPARAGIWWTGPKTGAEPVVLLHKQCAEAFVVKSLWPKEQEHWIELVNLPLFVGHACGQEPEGIARVRDDRVKAGW